MKVLLILVSCAVLGVQCDRVKRIVGGEQAAIPKPIPNLVQTAGSTKGSSSSENAQSTGSVRAGSSNKAAVTTPATDFYSQDSVYIYEEDRDAKIFGVREKDGYISFKGIRYAQPPLGRNRFQRPVIAHLKDKVEAFDYGSPCVQPLADNSGITGNEDCLFLNVYTPSVYSRNASGVPVFFWIHGGGFTRGSGNQYGVKDLVKKNIVVITMNYRLGTVGFLGSEDQQMAGNAGLFDVRAAFEWTKRYITYFGGDPSHIITAGQGSGASLAMLLAQSDFTAGYIKGVFAMSGTGISSNAVDYAPGNTSTFISQASKCSKLSPLKTIRCLQSTDLNSIVTVDKALEEDRIGDGGFVNAVSKLLSAGPVIEGKNDGRFLSYFLHNNPLDALKSKKMPKVPLLMGTAKSETGNAVTGKFKEDVTKRLKVPEFLNKVLPLSLVDNNIGLFTNGAVNKLVKTLFSNDKYLGFITSTLSKGLNDFQKVIETTTDALFNLPAATTTTLWSDAGGDSYFYSFEHESGQSAKSSFLEGMSLFSPDTSSTEKSPSHGDDLLYLFELQTLEGKPVPEAALKDSKDLKVKEVFVNVVSDFVKNGKPRLPNSKDEWRPYKDENTYGIISDQPKIEKKFRYCQVALWGGFVDKLTDPFCNLPGIDNVLKLIPQDLLKGGLLSAPAGVSKVIGNILPTNGGNVLPVGGQGSALGNIGGGLAGGLTKMGDSNGTGNQLPLLGGENPTSSSNGSKQPQLPLLGQKTTSQPSNGNNGKKQTTTPSSKTTSGKKQATTTVPIGQIQIKFPGLG